MDTEQRYELFAKFRALDEFATFDQIMELVSDAEDEIAQQAHDAQIIAQLDN